VQTILSKSEAMLLVALLALVTAALCAPPIITSPFEHDFADQRVLWGVRYAMDLFSNLPFALAGLAGMVALWRAPRRVLTNMQRAMLTLFFAGLLLVAFGSWTYHLDPSPAGLATDRYCMAVAFAGMLGLAAAGHERDRAGAAGGMLAHGLGLACVKSWTVPGDAMPWAVFQVGGMLVVWWMASLHPMLRALPVNWALVLLAYGAAKLLEINDYAIFEFTHHAVSGHTLKHLVASMAAWPVIAAVASAHRTVQNAPVADGVDEPAIRWWSNA
jgi:hypothetical protein